MRKYLIVGHTGVGKSSFINTVCGSSIAPSDPFEACTKEVKHYICTTPFGSIDLIDTPGLGENTPGSSEDTAALNRAYLDLVNKEIAQQTIDILVYVTRLDDTRFYPAEKRALQLITEHIGTQAWQGSWLVLTHAASVSEDHFGKAVQKRIEQISSFLQDLTGTCHVENQRFKHFAKTLLIDNIHSSWNNHILPGFTWKCLSPKVIELL